MKLSKIVILLLLALSVYPQAKNSIGIGITLGSTNPFFVIEDMSGPTYLEVDKNFGLFQTAGYNLLYKYGISQKINLVARVSITGDDIFSYDYRSLRMGGSGSGTMEFIKIGTFLQHNIAKSCSGNWFYSIGPQFIVNTYRGNLSSPNIDPDVSPVRYVSKSISFLAPTIFLAVGKENYISKKVYLETSLFFNYGIQALYKTELLDKQTNNITKMAYTGSSVGANISIFFDFK